MFHFHVVFKRKSEEEQVTEAMTEEQRKRQQEDGNVFSLQCLQYHTADRTLNEY